MATMPAGPEAAAMFQFLIHRLRRWLSYRPERHYMRGRG
jgi:hypothetical protein